MTTTPGDPGTARPPLSTNHAQNPILNSAFEEPHHHWPLDDNFRAMNNTPAASGRRPSGAQARCHTQSAGTAGAPPAGRPRGGGRYSPRPPAIHDEPGPAADAQGVTSTTGNRDPPTDANRP